MILTMFYAFMISVVLTFYSLAKKFKKNPVKWVIIGLISFFFGVVVVYIGMLGVTFVYFNFFWDVQTALTPRMLFFFNLVASLLCFGGGIICNSFAFSKLMPAYGKQISRKSLDELKKNSHL